MKISNFIIGMLLLGVLVSVFSNLIFRLDYHYEGLAGDNATDRLQIFNKTEKLTNLSQDLESSATNFSNSNNLLDKLESLFSQGYTSILISITSMNAGTEIISEGVNELPIQTETKGVLVGAAVVMLLIMVVVGIVLSTVTKREQ